MPDIHKIKTEAPVVIDAPDFMKIHRLTGVRNSTRDAIEQTCRVQIWADQHKDRIYINGTREAVEAARRLINILMMDVEVGMVFKVRVNKVMDMAMYADLPNTDQVYLHCSQLPKVRSLHDRYAVGDRILIEAIDIEASGNIRGREVNPEEIDPDRIIEGEILLT